MIKNKWALLALATFTFTAVMAIQTMSLPVLFSEIESDLGLSRAQIGWVWGATSALGMITSLLGGLLGDRFGTRRLLMWSCILAGGMGALRGFSTDFTSLALTSLLFGLIPPIIPLNVHKFVGVWFDKEHLGLANGVVSAGMALGFALGAVLSATVLSPLLGGWRNVLIAYGILSIGVGLIWGATAEEPLSHSHGGAVSGAPMLESLARSVRLPNVWLLGLGALGINACVQGVTGYLPLYLRDLGWSGASADGATASFHLLSLLGTIPIALLSDKLGKRQSILMICGLLLGVGVGSLALTTGVLVWVVVMVAGIGRDGFMSLLMTTVTELKGVGAALTGTAGGLVHVIMRVGMTLAPPIGNSLADYNPAYPFLFWAGLALLGVLSLRSLKGVR